MIVQHLISTDFTNGEISRLRMGEIEATDRTGRKHGIGFGQRNPGILFSLQQIEQQSLFGVIRTRRIAWSGTNASIALSDQIFTAELFVLAISPLIARLFV